MSDPLQLWRFSANAFLEPRLNLPEGLLVLAHTEDEARQLAHERLMVFETSTDGPIDRPIANVDCEVFETKRVRWNAPYLNTGLVQAHAEPLRAGVLRKFRYEPSLSEDELLEDYT